MSTPDLVAAAHDYQARGWRVIPLHRVNEAGDFCSCSQGGKCASKGKHPIDKAWQKSPRLSAADVQATWDVDKPPNLGIATGDDSGIWVLDIDPKGGGMETMAALVAEHGSLPHTFTVQTGSGGYHYFFTLPDFVVKNDQSGHAGQGIDVRGQGGQVVAAPSRTDRGAYVVSRDAPPVPAPEWLLELVRKPEHDDIDVVTAEDLPKPEDLDEPTWKRLTSYAQRAIDSELARLDACKAAATPRAEDYRGEPWNHTTFEVSCALLEFANSPWCAYSRGHALKDILERAPRDTEFDEYVIRKTFGSAVDKVGPKARPMPEDRRAEPDPLFGAPALPSTGSGGNAEPAALPRRQLFGGEKGSTPIYPQMAAAVTDRGPIGWGIDNDFWSYTGGVWTPDHWVVRHRLIDILGTGYQPGYKQGTIDLVQRHAYKLTGDPIEQLMNFGNGMLDWRTEELSEHAPEYGSTVQFGCDWDAEAECPQFDAWLDETLHPDYVVLAWEMIGYLMLSGNPKHHAFLLYGIGGSGKSTLLKVVTHLLGEANIAAETLEDLNGNRFRTASLFGRIANIAGDIDASYQENTATFKRITGQDTVTAEHKGLTPFRFVNWAVPVFSANKIPGSADVTEGYLRRWIILRFMKMVPDEKKIDDFDLQLARELSGIATKGVRALRALMERGYFDPQGEAIKGKEEFALTIDQVRRWFSDGNATTGPEISTNLDRIYQNYRIWAEGSGQTKLGQVEFSHRLEAIGYPTTKIGGETYHEGITVPEINQPHTTPANYFEN